MALSRLLLSYPYGKANRDRAVDISDHEQRAVTMQHDLPETVAKRAEQARANLVASLRECGQLADAVESFEGKDLLDVLIAIDSIRFAMAESSQILQGVVRGYQG